MAVFRVEKNKNYTSMANYHFRDTKLSWKAKGILSTMLSLPDNWDYSLAGLATLSADGMSATRSAIKELEEHGYLIRKPVRTNGKISDWEYIIFEKPQDDFLVVENQQVENVQVENVQVENETQLSTKELNTKKLSTKELNTKEKSIDYVAIANAYKEICTSFPVIRHLSEARKKAIKARINSGYTQDDFITLFRMAQESDFLKGKNDRKWSADFDWLIKDSNMAKVLDGKYANKNKPSQKYNYDYGQEGVDYL